MDQKFIWKEVDLPEKELMPGIWLRSVYHDNQLVTIVTFKPFASVPEHSHTEQQISVVVEGKLDININNEKNTAHKGDVIVIPPGVMHSVKVSPRGAKVIETWSSTMPEYIVPDGRATAAGE